MAGETLDNRGRGEASWGWPSIHPVVRKFALAAAAVSAVCAFMACETLAWPLAGVALGICAFFRDPQRVVPQDANAIVSPADGLVSLIMEVEPPAELCVADGAGRRGLPPGPVTRVSIFMSVFDVHINRAPVGGTVAREVGRAHVRT